LPPSSSADLVVASLSKNLNAVFDHLGNNCFSARAVRYAQRAVVAERFGEQSDSSEADLPKSSRLPFYFTITQVG
jgi:hypothetical protein